MSTREPRAACLRHGSRRGRNLSVALLLMSSIVTGADGDATLRQSPIDTESEPPRMSQTENRDIKRMRNYPMQPPTIPHKIDGYAVNLNANRCLACHGRRENQDSQAPMVSVTHYMDRDANFLAEVSPRRYFCNQCHVPQQEAKPLVDNDFQDVDALLKTGQ